MAVVGGPRESGYEAFVRAVANEGGVPPETAERYIVAVIATLEARLSFTDVASLEAELPAILRNILHREPILDLPAMDEKELLARVRVRLKVTREEAVVITRAVLRALRANISPAEVAIIDADLSPSLKTLWRE